MSLTLVDFFCGAGGSSQGFSAIPDIEVLAAANHWDRALESHAANFPAARHYQGDIREMDMSAFPRGDIFWASPECPTWSQARGKQRDYDKQPDLFGDTLPDEATERSRALMWDVPRYLEAMSLRGEPVLAGVVENVTDVRQWDRWRTWIESIEKLGYRTRLIAMNSMHARPRVSLLAPQSRDRLYLAYWATSLGRNPNWDKWLRPAAHCPSCGEVVAALQVFKKPGADMGRYKQQYVYRCPKVSCRGQIVEPGYLPAAAAIDWNLPGKRIGDRAKALSPKTMARIVAGFERYARPITLEAAGNTFERRPGVRTWPVDEPLTTQTASATKAVAVPPVLVPAGGTWRDAGSPVDEAMPARTCRDNDGVALPPFVTVLRGQSVTTAIDDPLGTLTSGGGHHGLVAPPFLTIMRGRSGNQLVDEPIGTLTALDHHGLVAPPLMVPVEGRDGKEAQPVTDPARTQTARAETGLVMPPAGDGYIPLAMLMRNNTPRGNAAQMCSPVTEAARTFTTAGHQSLVSWQHLLVPYYGTGVARSSAEAIGTLTAKARYALVSGAFDIDDALFRMLEPHEIGRATAFAADYKVFGSKREMTRQYGNAVTPPVSEVIGCALVECIVGEELDG
jgi:DNA (cytosine-5)-methyltransferase 1